MTRRGYRSIVGGMFIVMIGIFSPLLAYPGCDDPAADNYDSNATSNNNSCLYCGIAQLFDPPAACCDDLDASGICDYDEICVYPIAHGCTDPAACNYGPDAVVDVGNCIVCGIGHACTPSNLSCCDDPDNNDICGDQGAGGDGDGGGGDAIGGCLSSGACNYDPSVDFDNGSCVFPAGCNDWCTGDAGLVAYLDACGVCDSNLNNDNTTCVINCTHTPGATCDDGNPTTDNDVRGSDCICAGEVSDAAIDCQGVRDGPAMPGTTCDDGNPTTRNDTWNSSCICAGTTSPPPVDCEGTPGGKALPGVSCNDNDLETSNDIWDADCTCKGTPIIPTDCQGVVGGPDQPGESCSDSDATTIGDTWTNDCVCVGIPQQTLDCQYVPDGPALPGTSCDDGNIVTINDIWSTSCVCRGVVPAGVDCQNIPEGTALPGTSCDDGNTATVNDTWNESCACVGTSIGPDCQGVVNGPAAPGVSCDDGKVVTIDDLWNDVCQCIGVLQDGLDCEAVPDGTALPGTSCDDTNAATTNDAWDLSCNCVGELVGETFDCEVVPNGPALPGTSCDDGKVSTIDDVWNDACVCAGVTEHLVAEDPMPYPTVPGALYIDMQNPLVAEEFQDIIDEYAIDDIYKPFENLDLDIYRIEFDPSVPHEDLIAALQDRFGDAIDFAEPIPLIQLNIRLSASQTLDKQILPAYLSAIGYDKLIKECSYLFGAEKKSIRVAIIDNGYQLHDDLNANVVYTYDTADRDDDVYITDTRASCAHGNVDAGLVGAVSTNDIGIISAGYNPELVLIKATPDGRPCTDITAGIEGLAKAADYAHIINVSRGVSFDSKVLKKVVDKILKRGVVIVAAAGNFSSDTPFYPAAYPDVIAVGAVDDNNRQASFSNYGDWVDISAPGIDMLSTGLGNEYIKVSGTSQSAPLVAGWLAFLMSHGAPVEDLFKHISPLYDNDMGVGVIDAASFCADACVLDYSSLDYTADGRVDSQDAKSLQNRIANEFTLLGCADAFDPVTCCPEGYICDLNDDLVFDGEDLTILQETIEGSTAHDILGDGIDNNCDGLIDDAEHDAAPVATTASFVQQYGYWFLVLLLVFLGFLARYIWQRWIAYSAD